MNAAPYPPIDGSQPCRQVDSELFFPAKGGGGENTWDVRLAIALCATCDFIDDCLAYALTHDVSGIWGGTSHLGRKRLRQEYGITAEVVSDGMNDLDDSIFHPLRRTDQRQSA